jgi:thiamine biosynthesis lipoprotein
MGTAVSVHLADPLPAAEADRLVEDMFAWLDEVDRRFSTYRHDSEVSRLDRGELTIDGCSPQLRGVLDACARLWQATDGWFDPYATGRLDPSGYVKGWAVQQASNRLRQAGAVNHCINAGGDVRTSGSPAPGQRWRVGIRHPWQELHLCWVLTGNDLAVATSGTYERGYHVIDPRSGQPARQLRSVTLIGHDLALADAYATAALAMGNHGPDWLTQLPTFEWAVVTQDRTCYRSAGLPTEHRVR